MKKGEIYEAVVEKIEFPNKGILHVEEEKVIVKNAISGQKVRFVINKKRNGKCEGRLLEVLEASPLEQSEDACPHFGVCGGCLYQSLPYEEQLKIKEEQIKALLDSVCKSYEFEVKTGEILVALVTSSQTGAAGMPESLEAEKVLLEEWKETLLALKMEGSFAGILHIRNDTLADVVQSDETTVLYGKGYFYEELLGLKFQITPFSFFQTNSLGAEVLYETARGYVGETKDKVVFDLYSGTGTISQIIAPVAKKVVGVEIVEEAVGAAKENAEANGLYNCEFIAGDVLKVIDAITEKPDLIILDPPRDGIHPKALDRIINFGVDHLVYISCKPTSLVRDLVILQERGYKLERAVAVDMFPATANCETVAKLVRIKC